MENIHSYKAVSTNTRVIKCYFEPLLLYGCETWTVINSTQNLLEIAKMCFKRKIDNQEEEKNEDVLNGTEQKRNMEKFRL